jgi:hypothetical protein
VHYGAGFQPLGFVWVFLPWALPKAGMGRAFGALCGMDPSGVAVVIVEMFGLSWGVFAMVNKVEE